MRKFIRTLMIAGLVFAQSHEVLASCASPGSFTLNNPSSSNIFGTSINLTWGSSTDADTYTIYYRVSGSGTWLTESGGTGTSATLSGLSYGTAYQIKMVASRFCAGPPPEYEPIVSTRDSNTRTITTEPQAPSTYAGSNIGTSSFTASWTSRTGATSYDLDVSTSSSFTSFVSGYNGLNVSSTSQSVTGLSSATRYYYRVRSVNSSGESSNSSSRTVYTIPDTPTLNEASSETQTSFIVSWNAVDRADSYRLDVSTSSLFVTYVSGYQNLTVSGTNETVNGLTPGTTYYFRVRAYDSAGGTTSGNPAAKNTITIPDEPIATAATGFSEDSFTANWDVETGATNYRLDVSAQNDFSTYVSGYQNLNVTGTSRSVSGLSGGTTYYYRVRAENGSGTSSNSNEVETITIPGTPTANAATGITQTEFTANWEAETGASNYRLDVSEESDFSTYVAGYPMYGITDTDQSVVGLSEGGTYFYRVFASNGSGTSGSSSSIETLTIPTEPATTDAVELAETSVKATWETVTGANNYLLDVSPLEDFSEFLDGYEALNVTASNQEVSGLTGGQNYYYRVRAQNSTGISDYSNTTEALTVPTSPQIAEATDQTIASFVAHWEVVDGVDEYLLDVSTSSDFDQMVEGYNDLQIDASLLSQEVTDLNAGISYFYRVSAQNSSGNSDHSAHSSTITIPAQTSISGFSDHTATKFRITWDDVSGVDNYEVYVATDPNFTAPVDGNNPLEVQNIITEAFIEDLVPNTIYYVKVRSVNTSGYSDYSTIKTTSTTNSDGSVVTPSIDNLEFDDVNSKLSWGVSGGTGGITTITLSHRKITETEFAIEEISVDESGSYQISVEDDWMDALGMQYQVEVEDLAGRNDISDLVTYNKAIDEVNVPIAETFGTSINDYQIISIPYELSTTRIEDLFEGILGSYDKSKWRLLKYKDDETGYLDYEEGLSVSNVQRGVGYWFISSESVDLTFGEGLTPSNTIDKPFELNLTQGWNQIGNPYLENIAWSDVLATNGNPETVGSLFIYNSSDAAFEEGTELPVFGGGFVFADQPITLTIPVDINLSTTGGRLNRNARTIQSTTADWALNFSLSQGQKTNSLAGIGMNPLARNGKDQYDVLNPPYLGDYISMHTVHSDFFYEEFAKDIVGQQDQYHWTFQLQSSANAAVHLSWGASPLPEGALILYDKEANQLIDMTQYSSHTFCNGNQSFSIYYSSESMDIDGIKQLGQGFPNPVVDQVQIPYGFHIGQESSMATLKVYDINGTVIASHTESSTSQGIRSLVWERDNELSSGLYFYRVESITGNHSQVSTGKLIIN